MLRFFKRTKKRAELRNELHSFTDRELRDLGINRSDIEDIVRKSFK